VPAHAKAVGIVARVLRALRLQPWRSAHELAAVTRMPVDANRRYLLRMRSEGLVRARRRAFVPDADGEVRRGPKPLEYRIATEWGGVWTDVA
jgi:DNA-binding IclR family transcriptional regulator